ncbi:hypothetical protein [Enteractinococcus coprophilus]|uniref:Uncharacterized protein n=1 Tax=Enteractinococcus coprophilus TaxID=1027633 RepID=A0A543A0D7_9MICC|nr:hypothetical protein [Enteractinococcus coprophilus]TQL66039.1 hypothetical protein FB556_2518 [Enteractinococcus coprophilus]
MSRITTKNTLLTSVLLASLLLSGCGSEASAPRETDDVPSETATAELKNDTEVSAVAEDQDLGASESADAGQGDVEAALAERGLQFS